jgi:hypothetical protein
MVSGRRTHSARSVGHSNPVAERFDVLIRRAFFVVFAIIEDCYP